MYKHNKENNTYVIYYTLKINGLFNIFIGGNKSLTFISFI